MLAALKRFVTWSAVAALLAMSPTLTTDVHADGEPVQITIRVTDAGFEPNRIEVEQGSLVEITFVWDHVGYPLEEHIMVFNDFKVESDQIDSEHRETTVQLIATETGTFTFKCDLECDLHDYTQNGELVVLPSGGGGSAAFTPTKLIVQPAGVSVRRDTVSVIASLEDDDGNAVPKAELRFFLEETFVGTTSLVEVKVAETDEGGLTRITYKPTTEGAANLIVRFAGAGIYDAAETVVEVPRSTAFGPAERDEAEHLVTLRLWAPGGFLVVILGIWATFGFVLYKAWAVSRVREEGGEN